MTFVINTIVTIVNNNKDSFIRLIKFQHNNNNLRTLVLLFYQNKIKQKIFYVFLFEKGL